MVRQDLPQFIDSGHAHTVYGLGNLNQGMQVAATTGLAQFGGLNQQNQAWLPSVGMAVADFQKEPELAASQYKRIAKAMQLAKPEQLKKEDVVTRRLVQVFIADPNENVPLEDSLLYSGEQKLTDATDQELFFEIDMKTILAAYNEKRVKIIDKKVRERTEYLEPAKIRDLKMVVVTVAGF